MCIFCQAGIPVCNMLSDPAMVTEGVATYTLGLGALALACRQKITQLTTKFFNKYKKN